MSNNNEHVCVLCGVVYTAPSHLQRYLGLCSDHVSRDTLREWDRIESARGHLHAGQQDTLRLDEWLSIIASYRGCCALCEFVPFGVLELWTPGQGLTASNAVPQCRACSVHHRGNWDDAVERVALHLQVEGVVP
jgi:hypothetical protein